MMPARDEVLTTKNKSVVQKSLEIKDCINTYIIIIPYTVLLLRSQPRYRLVCTGVPPPKVCPCGDLTGSGRDLAWFSGV